MSETTELYIQLCVKCHRKPQKKEVFPLPCGAPERLILNKKVTRVKVS